ncbi:hypothetical protein A6R68_10066 [Neotoma lepida]|uniref:Transmembrane protein 109 n=1 Tax=Neotoma lepida TaxID=56216 RepID=A0A1A6FXT0_NEOLE|nr:hypothetical protein A6R68_10066 [Neotoma lepida]
MQPGALLLDANMAGSDSNLSWSRHLFKAVLMVLVALLLIHSSSSQSHRDFASPGQQKREASADLLTQIGRSLKEMLDTWLGPETMHVISETLLQVMWAISSAISVACFALSGIAAQLLSALGLDGLVLALLGRILGGLKLVLFVAGFVGLVRSVPDPSTRALMLLALLTLFALLSRLTGSRGSGTHLEAKVRGLERQIEELRGRQRRAAKAPRSVEEE